MKQLRHYLLICILFLSASSFAQDGDPQYKGDTADYPYWIDMMQDPSANYYQTLRAFDIYWKDREVTKGCGYKPFLRWAHEMQYRVDADGYRIKKRGNILKNYRAFKANAKSSSVGKDYTWTCLGPINKPNYGSYVGTGRVNAIAFHPTDPNTIYVGAPAGGLWISTDNGANWTVKTDDLPTLGVSSIVVDKEDANRIILGTGDRDADDARGLGIFISTDGGETFNESNEGFSSGATVGRLIQDPSNPNVVIAASTSGVFRSTDKGSTWERTLTGNCWDVVFKPGSSDVVYAVRGTSVYKSTDNGVNWSKCAVSSVGSRGVIGVSPANPEVIYLFTGGSSVNQGGFGQFNKSTDAGETWTKATNVPNIMGWNCSGSDVKGQSWYDIEIAVDPDDANVVYTGGVNIWRTTNGGQNWSIHAHWTGSCGVAGVHADQHVFEFNPLNGYFYTGNDGGVTYSTNKGETFTDISDGLAISQIYKLGQSRLNKDKLICGFQDNGTSIYDGDSWTSVLGGDGMDCVVDHMDDQYSYGALYYGNIDRIKGMQRQVTITGSLPDNGAWVTPYVLDESNSQVMYVGMNYLWIGTNIRSAAKWTKIIPPVAAKISVVEHSPANPDNLYIFNAYGKLYKSLNIQDKVNIEWERIDENIPDNSQVMDIEAHPIKPNTVYIATSTNIFKSDDGGVTYESLTLNLPDVQFRCLEYYKGSADGLYVGTDAGVYYKDQGMDEWLLYSEGFPVNSSVRDIEIFYAENDSDDVVRAATYGRGVWEAPVYRYAPTANFKANVETTSEGCYVDFINLCGGAPSSYEWTFEGAETTSSNVAEPTNIKYNNAGTYNVKLKVSSDLGDSEELKEGYITVEPGIAPVVEFDYSKVVICQNETVEFFDISENCPQEWTWSVSPNNIEFVDGTNENSQNPKIKFLVAGDYSITLKASNKGGETEAEKTDLIHVGGLTLPFIEDFNEFPNKEQLWSYESKDANADDDSKWGTIRVKNADNSYSNAAYYNNFSGKTSGGRFSMITPSLDLRNVPAAYLNFEYAYCQRYSVKDSLIVKVSTDCGATWKRIYANGPNGDGVFATADRDNDSWAPKKADQWCGAEGNPGCIELDLSEFIGNEFVKIAFEDYCKKGNNLYVDNVTVTSTIGLEDVVGVKPFNVSPNPASGIVKIHAKDAAGKLIQLIDANGKIVYQTEMATDHIQMNVEEYTSGIYMLQLIGDYRVQTQKLIVK